MFWKLLLNGLAMNKSQCGTEFCCLYFLHSLSYDNSDITLTLEIFSIYQKENCSHSKMSLMRNIQTYKRIQLEFDTLIYYNSIANLIYLPLPHVHLPQTIIYLLCLLVVIIGFVSWQAKGACYLIIVLIRNT